MAQQKPRVGQGGALGEEPSRGIREGFAEGSVLKAVSGNQPEEGCGKGCSRQAGLGLPGTLRIRW